MPLILRQHTDGGELLLWRIDESEEELLRLVMASDAASAGRFANPARRAEHLAWRAALRCVVPDGEVEYDEVGAPRLAGDGRFIGVSHSKGYAAVLVADCRCAVDIEVLGRDFSRSASRFISEQERGFAAAAGERFEALVWCAKECAYKYSGRKELDLLKDIRIVGVDGENIRVAVVGLGEICMKAFTADSVIVVYTYARLKQS